MLRKLDTERDCNKAARSPTGASLDNLVIVAPVLLAVVPHEFVARLDGANRLEPHARLAAPRVRGQALHPKVGRRAVVEEPREVGAAQVLRVDVQVVVDLEA